MKPAKIREMNLEELGNESRNLSDQLLRLRLQKAMGQQDNVNKIRGVRRDLARIKTVQTEKQNEGKTRS